MFSQSEVINNLREERQRLEDKIEAVNVLVETAHSQGKMDYSTYSVFKKILEAEV